MHIRKASEFITTLNDYSHFGEWQTLFKKILPYGTKSYDFSNDDMNVFFNSQFEFAYMDLPKNWKGLINAECYFFFEDVEISKASSDPRYNEKFISISKPLFKNLCQRAEDYNSVIDRIQFLTQLNKERAFKKPIAYFLIRFGFLFLYYHELGHIIQDEEPREMSGKGREVLHFEDIIKLHVEELDADRFGVPFIVRHIFGHWISIDEKYKSSENLTAFIAIALAAHFIVMDIVHAGISPLYIWETKYPHESMRIVDMAHRIVSAFKSDKYNFQINSTAVLGRLIDILNGFNLIEAGSNYLDTLLGNGKDMEAYFQEIDKQMIMREYLATNKHKNMVVNDDGVSYRPRVDNVVKFEENTPLDHPENDLNMS